MDSALACCAVGPGSNPAHSKNLTSATNQTDCSPYRHKVVGHGARHDSKNNSTINAIYGKHCASSRKCVRVRPL